MIKMNEKEFKNYIGNNIKSISSKISLEEINFLNSLVNAFNEVCMKYDKSQNNWNELKKGLKSLFEFDEGVVSKDYLECAEDTLEKMQELEGNNDSSIKNNT